MRPRELQKLVPTLACQVIGWEDAGNDGHRKVLAIIARAFNHPGSLVLCEPSLVRQTRRPPDIVVIDPYAGLIVIEVKSVTLKQVRDIQPGGQLCLQYASGVTRRNVIAQVRNAMFDIKDEASRRCAEEFMLPCQYFVAFPHVTRSQWLTRWGEDGYCPPELLFAEDITPALVGRRLSEAPLHQLAGSDQMRWPETQIRAACSAFGDVAVIYPAPSEREPRTVKEGTLGERFDNAKETYKALSDEQQALSAQNWEEGPRLVRGVAGSGKTIVLANNLARRIIRHIGDEETVFDDVPAPPKVLAVCYNRTLAPFIKRKIEVAYQQRTGQPLPDDCVEVFSLNRLMYRLSQQGACRYQQYWRADEQTRAAQYLRDIRETKHRDPDLVHHASYDAVYVDEGQDMCEEEFVLLKELCRTDASKEPNLYVFYDDAQNLYGRKRPNWRSLGINIVGRSHVMKDCFRNTRQIIEPAFNMLYGNFAINEQPRPSREFAGVNELIQQNLISDDGGVFRVHFAKRNGLPIRLTIQRGFRAENQAIVNRIRWLVHDQEVRPEDIQVLAHEGERLKSIARAVIDAGLDEIKGVHLAVSNKDQLIYQRGHICLSTVHSAKGYDAPCVLIASTEAFSPNVEGRATFYVACTRASDYLELFAKNDAPLVREMRKAIEFMETSNPVTSPVA